MNGRLRVIETARASGRWNTAVSAALLLGRRDPGDACMRFYRFDPCVLLGATQPYASGAAHGLCAKRGIEIARRVTGGGSVYMSPTMLAWDLVTSQSAPVEAMAEKVTGAMAEALRGLGFTEVTSSATGLAIGGRKVAGVAMGSDRGTFLIQGTLLLDDESQDMAAALGLDNASLAPHVTFLGAHSRRAVNVTELGAALAAKVAQAFGFAQKSETLPLDVQALAQSEYVREIGTEAFVRGAAIEALGKALA